MLPDLLVLLGRVSRTGTGRGSRARDRLGARDPPHLDQVSEEQSDKICS